MSTVVTISNITAPGINDSAVYYGGMDVTLRFPPVREIDTFSFDVTFTTLDTLTMISTPLAITSVEFSPATDGIVLTNLTANSYRIHGQATNVFTNKFYRFRTDEGELIQSSVAIPKYYGMYYYSPEPRRYIELEYIFHTASGSFSRFQTIQNDWDSSRLAMKQLVQAGK